MSNNNWPDEISQLHRAAVERTIRRASMDELQRIGTERFAVANDPWCERYFDFLKDHPHAKYYRAEVGSIAEVVYCREPSKGMWFMPGLGMGLLRERGLPAFEEIVDAL